MGSFSFFLISQQTLAIYILLFFVHPQFGLYQSETTNFNLKLPIFSQTPSIFHFIIYPQLLFTFFFEFYNNINIFFLDQPTKSKYTGLFKSAINEWDHLQQQSPNFLQQIFILTRMCYLKNLIADESIDFDELMKKSQETQNEQIVPETNVLIPCLHKHLSPIWSHEQQMLINIFEFIDKNNSMIRQMNKSLKDYSQYLEKGLIQTEKQLKYDDISHREISRSQNSASQSFQDSSLVAKIFGAKKYQYSLELNTSFPKTLYKERNFNLDLKLVDAEGKIIRNCNIINLCCAICSCEAQWIHENRVGEPFLKGKTEVELYKGEASFAKIYAREVSRVYPEGKINLVIYSKPTTLLYSGSSSYQLTINSEEIRPLVIEDIIIKAKKKE